VPFRNQAYILDTFPFFHRHLSSIANGTTSKYATGIPSMKMLVGQEYVSSLSGSHLHTLQRSIDIRQHLKHSNPPISYSSNLLTDMLRTPGARRQYLVFGPHPIKTIHLTTAGRRPTAVLPLSNLVKIFDCETSAVPTTCHHIHNHN
jgi:hypothetical protein